MSVPVSTDDYIIVEQLALGKPLLARVTSVKGNNIRAIRQPDHLDSVNLELTFDDVLANLGDDPTTTANAFGVQLRSSRCIHTKVNDRVGDIHFFYTPDAAEGSAVMRAVDDVYHDVLYRYRLTKMLDNNLSIEIHSGRGLKYGGMFQNANKKRPNTIILYPDEMPAESYPYVLAHEFGHMLHLVYLKGRGGVQAELLKLFQYTSEVDVFSRDEVIAAFDDLLASRTSPIDYYKSIENEEDKKILQLGFRYIHQTRGYDLPMLDTMYQGGEEELVKKLLYGVQAVSKRERVAYLTEYAAKNPNEFFAECFAHHVMGQMLPKECRKFMEKVMPLAANLVATWEPPAQKG